MKLRRIWAMLLCLLMAFTATAAIGEEDYFADKDFSEHLTISFASIQINENQNYYDSDEWCKWWGDTFNLEYEITAIASANWAENLRIWISSGDMPEWAAWSYNHADLVNYADQGLIKKLPDDWKEKYPNLAATQEYVQLAGMDEELLGGTYCIFRPVFSLNFPADKVGDHYSCYLRKDWAAAVGYEIETGDAITISELFDLAAKLKEADPGNVGEGFYPIQANTSQLMHLAMWGGNAYATGGTQGAYFLGEDGKHHWGPAEPEIGEVLAKIQGALNDGLINPEFYALGQYDANAMFYSLGTTAISFYQGMAYRMDEMEVSMRQDLGIEYDDCVAAVIITDDEGNFHDQSIANYYGANIFSPDISDEKLDRLLSMMDYSVTVEGQQKIHYGIPGVDYEVNEDGSVTVLRPEDAPELWDAYAMLPTYVNLVALSDDFQFENPAYSELHRKQAKLLYENRAKFSTEETFPSTIDWNVALFNSPSKNLASMSLTDEYAMLITMEGDIMTNWQNWVNEKMSLIQPVLDELDATLVG